MRLILPLISAAFIVAAALFLFPRGDIGTEASRASGGETPPACQDLTNQEIGSIAGAYLKKQGYENFGVTSIGPLYCENSVGVRNMVAEAIIDGGMPSQHNTTIRLQMRSAAGEMKIYEVVLARPA